MAYEAPTAEEFKARFPEFAAIGDPLIGILLDEAGLFADVRWSDADRKVAVLHLAAHAAQQFQLMQAAAGIITGGSSSEETLGEMYVKSVKFADREVTWEKPKTKTTEGMAVSTMPKLGSVYSETIYGQLYLRLLRRNVGGPVVI